MEYATVKVVHQGAVVLSLSGFLVRGAASLAAAAWVNGRGARTIPHGIDTVVLGSGLWLAWTLGATPGHAPWLYAKLIGLLLYIALGMVAMRPSYRLRLRCAAWGGALLTAAWMVSVALTKSALGFLG